MPGLEERIASQVIAFATGRHDDAIAWLVSLGCRVTTHGDGSWTLVGLTGMTCGLMRCSPIDAFPVFGFLLAGMFWPHVYPRLPKLVDAAYKKLRQEGKPTATKPRILETHATLWE